MNRYQSITDLHQRAAKTEDRVALTQAVVDDLAVTGKVLDALVYVDGDFATDQAKKIKATDHPLSGVPLAHKELYGRTGWPFEGGSKTHQGALATETAHTISKLDALGAIDCGRLTSVEFALGVTGHNDYAGTPKNPWNTDYICGGSSSGSAAIVAAGVIPGSLGSDTGGSIRLPAAACGLVGIKPSHGLVSRAGIFPLSASLDTSGPLTRSVEDAAVMLEAIAGHDPRDPLSLDVSIGDWRRDFDAGLKGIRIARAEHYFLSGVDAPVADATETVFTTGATLGASIHDVDVSSLTIEMTNTLNVMLIASEAARLHLDTVAKHHQDMNDQTVMRIITGIHAREEEQIKLRQLRADMIVRFIDHVFAETDVLITPVWPFLLPTISDSDIGAKPDAAPLVQRIGHNTRPFNFLGLPVVVIPIGLDRHGLPLSVQLVGKPFSEALLLRVARAFERHYAFWDQHPTGWENS
jgi:aspartyl-tRNA(Asn)/glutamyl-tRNA(Gln) amidotransferase subunit A